MENLLSLDSILVDTNDAAASMVDAFQKVNKANPTASQTDRLYKAVIAFDIALEHRGAKSFTAWDATTRAAVLELHKAFVLTAYQINNK